MVHIKYFGAIAEKTGKEQEDVDMNLIGTELLDLKTYCLEKYEGLAELSFQLAVNQSLMENGVLNQGDEIAFLPPFAGG